MSTAEYPMWACDRGSISVAAILVVPNDREQTTARTKEVWGRVQHWGDASTEGPPLSGDHQVVGPHDHAYRGGWFLQYHSAADDASSWSSPKQLGIRAQQIEDGSVLLLALAYPAATTFVVRRSNGARAIDYLTYTTATSVTAIRQDSGASKYHFDGTYLYLRMPDLGTGGFGEDGLYVPIAGPAFDAITITATWAGATGCGSADWCRAATQDAPAASVGEIAGATMAFPCAVSAGSYWPIGATLLPPPGDDDVSLSPSPSPSPSGGGIGSLAYSFEIVVAGTIEQVSATEASIKSSVASKAGVSTDQVTLTFAAASVLIGVTITATNAAGLASIAANVDPLLVDTTQAASLLGSSVTIESIRSKPTPSTPTGVGNNLGPIIGAGVGGAAVLLVLAVLIWRYNKRKHAVNPAKGVV